MSLIDEIRNSDRYNFYKLSITADFKDLGEYVNIHDKSNDNLLLWMLKTKFSYTYIIHYINTYYKLFDYDKLYKSNNSLLLELSSTNYLDIALYILKKINFIKEIIKINMYNTKLLNFWCISNELYSYNKFNRNTK